tara:strand:+ start:967 stop:1323 length:357 start_codon:yes stop_codon:yes gene_type:complete
MKNKLASISVVLGCMLLTFFPSSKLSAESHKLEITIKNCQFAKEFARKVIEKRKVFRPLSFYEKIDFASPVAMEIVWEAYATEHTEPEFSNDWFEKCKEISCSEFWANLEIAIKIISE